MFVQLAVVFSLLAQAWSQSPFDTSFGTVVPIIVADQASQFSTADMFFNGDLLAAGWTQGLLGLPTEGGSDFLLQRYEADGTLAWTKILISSAGKVGLVDFVYAVGYTFTGSFNGHPIVALNDASIAKVDSAGNKIFFDAFDGDQNDRGNGLALDETRGVFYAVGDTGSTSFNGQPRIGDFDGCHLEHQALWNCWLHYTL